MKTHDRLIHMANQIAANVMHEPDPVAAVANHISLFWDPRMKQEIRAADRASLSPVASQAVDLIH
jgi:formate dehydrogenase subunit delta